jgi:hypothetical protein
MTLLATEDFILKEVLFESGFFKIYYEIIFYVGVVTHVTHSD